jgi:hypothetical protein
MKPKARINRIRLLTHLIPFNDYDTVAAFEHCAALFSELTAEVEALKLAISILREGEQIAPPGVVVLTASQAVRVRDYILEGAPLIPDDLAALGIEVDRARRAYCTAIATQRIQNWADPDGWLDVMSRRVADEEWGEGEGRRLFPTQENTTAALRTDLDAQAKESAEELTVWDATIGDGLGDI